MTAAAKKAAAAPAKKAESDETPDSKPAKKSGNTYKANGLIQVPVGEQVLQFFAGDVLPAGIGQDTLDRLLEDGLIADSE